jgi:uroporphyrinogen-III synthase
VTVTSGAIAEAAIRLFGPWIRARSWRIASLSPVTSAAVRRFGLEPTVEATAATVSELVAAIVRHEQSRSDQSAGSPQAANSPAPISG